MPDSSLSEESAAASLPEKVRGGSCWAGGTAGAAGAGPLPTVGAHTAWPVLALGSAAGSRHGEAAAATHLHSGWACAVPLPWSSAGCQGQMGWVDLGLPATLLLAEQCFMQNHSIDNM